MNQKYYVLFEVLEYGLWKQNKSSCKKDVDYSCVYDILRKHRVDCLVADVWDEFTDINSQEMFRSVLQNIGRWHQLMKLQDEILSCLKEQEIASIILKGASAAVYYPKPEYRRMGDIDIIVKPEKFEQAQQVLLNIGFVQIDESEKHIEFLKDKKLVELHHYFVEEKDRESRKKLNDYIFSKIDSAEIMVLEGFSFPVLPKLECGLSMLYHISEHLETGLGLRQIIDWMLFVDKELNDDFWNACFKEKAKELELEKLAVIVTGMCQKYLGLREDITWCSYADEAVCDELMVLILEAGNFGRNLSKVEHKVMRSGSLSSFFSLLQDYGAQNWELLEKYQWLKPFAWMYQLGKYIRLYFLQRMSVATILSDMRLAKKKSELLNTLEITRRFVR